MREIVTSRFESLIAPFLHRIESVAVVGGSIEEPEVQILRKLKTLSVTRLGIDPDCDHHFNLNYLSKLDLQFDLVLCSQVLEHIWDVKVGIQNLANITSPEGILWIACPASNRSHGSPYFFAAGYQPELISNLGELFGCSSLAQERIGSKRNYFFTHALRVWPTPEEARHPVSQYNFARYGGGKLKKSLRFIRDLPGRIYSCFISSNVTSEIEYATETYVMLKRNK